MPKEQIAAAQQFSVWLSEVCKDARHEANINAELVAGYAGVTSTTVKRFEDTGAGTVTGQSRLVAAYAKACDIEDGRDLYRAAMERWFEHSEPLTLEVLERATTTDAQAGPRLGKRRPKLSSERANDEHGSGAR